MGGATYLHKRQVYGFLRAMYVTMFHCVGWKILVLGDPGTFWLISPKLHGLYRDYNVFPAGVQRPYLVMVTLSQKRFCEQYGWFCHGWSHNIIFPLEQEAEQLIVPILLV